MALNVSSLSRNGLRDWLIQRVSAVVMVVYSLFLVTFLLRYNPINYYLWKQLFSSEWMKLFTVLFLLSLLLHAWIGVWTVATDYVKSTALRLIFYTIVILALTVFLVWGIEILWGI